MALEVRIDGAAQLRQVTAQLKASGSKGLGQQMGKALTKALAPIGRAIEAEADKVMPSGYGPTLTASLRHRRSTRTTARSASVRLVTTGDGKKDDRDLPSLNAGKLRHPVYGRFRRTATGVQGNPWAVTSIKSGFHDRGIEKAGPEAERGLVKVLDDYADRLAKG